MVYEKKSYKIIGLDCASCAKTLEAKLKQLEGIKDIRFNIANKRIYIEYEKEQITNEEIKKRIKKTGYSVYEELEDTKENQLLEKKSKGLLRLITQRNDFYTTLASLILFVIGILLEFVFLFEIAAQVVLIIATIIGGIFIAKKAYFSIRNLRLDINILMIVAAIAALAIQEEVEATSIVLLFSIAEIAENVSVDRSKKSIEDLVNFAPTEATTLTADGPLIVPANEVPIGSIISVKTGDRIPLDGVITKGVAYINQASITGESVPVKKTAGDEIFAGTLCEDGLLEAEITKNYDDIFLKKIVELVENTDQRAPIERFIDIFAKYYTPIMFLIAILTLIIPPLVTGDPFSDWVVNALVILVISCPCAVVLSTPISIVVAISRSARNGVLIKGGKYIETLSKTKVIAFDKTGTVTIGHPVVEDIIPMESYSEQELLQISGSLEQGSKHPIAKAIIEKMSEEHLHPLKTSDVNSITGQGIEGIINGERWFIGNYRLMQKRNLELKDHFATDLAIMQSEQKTVVLIGKETSIVGMISVRDKLKDHAKGLIRELRDLKIRKTIMLTGDNSKTAQIMAKDLNIDEVYAELLPDEKMAIINELQEEYDNIAMLGDGINDAPALAHAKVGIALGASGSDIALDSADIALMTDSFDSLHYLFSVSRRTMQVIIINVIIAILVKLTLFILSYFYNVPLWAAVLIGDMGVSLFVIFNAILRVRGKQMTHEYCDDTSDEMCPIEI